jgi:hypothetical protein
MDIRLVVIILLALIGYRMTMKRSIAISSIVMKEFSTLAHIEELLNFSKYSDVTCFCIEIRHDVIPVDKSENAKLIAKYMLGRRKHFKGSKNITSNKIPFVITPKMPITKTAMSDGNSNGLVDGAVLFIVRVNLERKNWKNASYVSITTC